jgi:hypothetical protein
MISAFKPGYFEWKERMLTEQSQNNLSIRLTKGDTNIRPNKNKSTVSPDDRTVHPDSTPSKPSTSKFNPTPPSIERD